MSNILMYIFLILSLYVQIFLISKKIGITLLRRPFFFYFFPSEQDTGLLPTVGLFRLTLYNITILNNTGANLLIHLLSLITSLFFFSFFRIDSQKWANWIRGWLPCV